MESTVNIQCSQGRNVIRVCSTPKCNQAPLICQKLDCECQIPHIRCLMTPHLINIICMLRDKGKSIQPAYVQLANWYEEQIKLFTINLSDIRKVMQKSSLILQQDQSKLYNMMTEGRSSEITSELVKSVIQSLTKQQDTIIKDKLNNIHNKLQQNSKQINKILQNIKQLADSIQSIQQRSQSGDVKFKNLCHTSFQILDGKILKLKSDPSAHVAALLQSSVQSFGNKKQLYKYKINKSGGHIMLGFCHLKQAQQEKYTNNHTQTKGSYIVYSVNGSIFSHIKQQPYHGNNKITKIDANDIIHILYIPLQNKVLFKNITKNTQSQIEMKQIANNPLHACVLHRWPPDEVQFLGLQLIG